MCDPVVFAHLQCGPCNLDGAIEPSNLDGTNLGSCWCRQRAMRFGQRELLLPYAWKSLFKCCLLGISLLALADFAYR